MADIEWQGMLMITHKLDFLSVFFVCFSPYCVACGTLVPQLGIETLHPAMVAQSLKHGPTRDVPKLDFLDLSFFTFAV